MNFVIPNLDVLNFDLPKLVMFSTGQWNYIFNSYAPVNVTPRKGRMGRQTLGDSDTGKYGIRIHPWGIVGSGFPLFSKYQIPGFLKVFGLKFQVFSRFSVPNLRYFHTNFSCKNREMC